MSQIPIYTIGYGARQIEELITILKANNITYLVDVRSKPYSNYKPEFSKNGLAEKVEESGVRYLFMGDTLGGQPDDPACYTDQKVDYSRVAVQSFYKEGIGRLQEAYRQQLPVALMCSEGKPEMCHRSKLIGQTLTAAGISVIHIDENDQLITQEDVLLRLNKGQPSLFGEDFYQFSSRKRYQDDNESE